MVGYDGFSMSNNAVAAYDSGLCPASKIGRGLPAWLIERFCDYEEWHHCSKEFNEVGFYNPEKVLATFGLVKSEDYEVDPAAVEAFAKYKAEKKSAGEVFENCTVCWLEWGGTRKHPKCTEREASGCKVVVKGQTATITLPSGSSFIKRLNTNGFSFYNQKEKISDVAVKLSKIAS